MGNAKVTSFDTFSIQMQNLETFVLIWTDEVKMIYEFEYFKHLP